MSVKEQLIKSIRYRQLLDVMYLAKSGAVTKRRIKVLKMHEQIFQAYCFSKQAKRTFTIENVLACVPVISREKDVI